MAETKTFPIVPSEKISGYHAHVYYTDATREKAARMRQEAWSKFDVVMGRFRDRAVGPHPVSMYQIEFGPEEFPKIVPWLMTRRDDLTIMIHPETGNGYDDHAFYPLWLGGKLDLRLQFLLDGGVEA